jgi:tetratricopeptide (TPR) repeat protein
MSTGGPRKPRKSQAGFMAVLLYYLTAPGRWIAGAAERRKMRRARDRAENVPQRSFLRRFLGAITFPFFAAAEGTGQLFRGIGSYLVTRNGMFLLQGIPAVLVFAGTVALTFLALSVKPPDLIRHYKSEGDKAVRESTKFTDSKKKVPMLERAQLCFERWMMLEPGNDEAKYSHAMACFETKEPVEMEIALNEMKQLAPHDRAGGSENAHKWLAQYYFKQMEESKDPQQQRAARELAEVHLMRVLINDNDDYSAHRQLADLYMRQSRFEKAEKHLLVASQYDPGANADLARLYFLMAQPDKAEERGVKARNYFHGLLASDPGNVEYRFVLADLYVVQKNFQQAIEILEEGMVLNKEDKIQQKVSRILLDAMLEIPQEQFEERLKYFDKAIAIDPKNDAAFSYIVYYLKESNPVASMVQERIDEAIANSNSPTLHLIMSDYYLKEGKPELSRKHLEAVLRSQPEFLPALNNLANVYAMSRPPDFERALDLINTCLKFADERHLSNDARAYFHDTRGQIYTIRRQWREGAVDLEKAVAYGLNQNLATHKALLRCYQEMNKKDLIDEEIRVIAKLKEIQERAKEKGQTTQ